MCALHYVPQNDVHMNAQMCANVNVTLNVHPRSSVWQISSHLDVQCIRFDSKVTSL